MENYIIRIYRHAKDNSRNIVGTVEEVGLKGKKAFTDYDELWDILSPSPGRGVPAENEAKKAGRRRRT